MRYACDIRDCPQRESPWNLTRPKDKWKALATSLSCHSQLLRLVVGTLNHGKNMQTRGSCHGSSSLPKKKVNFVLSDCICSYFHIITMLTLHDSTRLHGQLNVCRYMVELTTVLTFKEEKCDKRATIWIEISHQQYIIFIQLWRQPLLEADRWSFGIAQTEKGK